MRHYFLIVLRKQNGVICFLSGMSRFIRRLKRGRTIDFALEASRRFTRDKLFDLSLNHYG